MIFAEFENSSGTKLRPYEDLEIVLSSHTVTPPKPKTHFVQVDGADGNVDLSEWAGEIKFEDRTVKAVFTCIADRSNHSEVVDIFKAFMLGRRLKITFSDEAGYYYDGRCTSVEVNTEKNISTIECEFVCKPYKTSYKPTVIKKTVSNSVQIWLKAMRKTVIPTITVDKTVTLTYGALAYTMQAGTRQIPGIVVTDTAKMLTVTGACNITLQWVEGVL